jgi:hypothetical protein
MASRSLRFGARSQKLSNIYRSLDGCPNFYNLLRNYRVSSCFGGHVNLLVPAAFAVISTYQSTLGPRGGLWPDLYLLYNMSDS